MSDATPSDSGVSAGTVAAIAAAVLIAAGGVAIGVGTKDDPDPAATIPLAAAQQLGLVPPAATYKVARSDGGFAYVAFSKDDAGNDVKTVLDHSPCTKRPAKTDPASCVRSVVDPVSGKPVVVDPGDENVMQAGEGVGPGCVETACAVFFGEDPP